MPYALPPQAVPIDVLDCAQGLQAVETLSQMGRKASLVKIPVPCEDGAEYRLWDVPAFLYRLPLPSQNEQALCLGCGSGREAIFLASLGWKVTAVDHLPEAIEIAKKLESLYSVPPIQWLVKDSLQALGEGPPQYQLVTSLMHFQPQMLSLLNRHLPYSAEALIETWSEERQIRTGSPKSKSHILTQALVMSCPDLEFDYWEEQDRAYAVIRRRSPRYEEGGEMRFENRKVEI